MASKLYLGINMLFRRNSAVMVYEGQDTGNLSSYTLLADLADNPIQRQAIISTSGETSQSGEIVAGDTQSYTVVLPEGYTNASYLHVTIIVEGLVRVKTTSPDHGASTTLIQGSSTSPGILQFCEKVTTLSIENTDASNAVKFAVCCVQMPDISDEDNFRGLQADGTQSSVS